MGNFTSTYTNWAFSSKKFLKKLPIYMWPMCAHVHPYVNYEWIKTQLRLNLNLIKSELRINWKWIKSQLEWIKSELKVN
jgi:hypothetical protein